MPTLHRTIVRPLITEASSMAYQDRGEYHFEVHPEANKLEIRQAIQTLFGVRVTGVWTSNHRGKSKRMGKSGIIAETGAGQHGVASATARALLNLECIVYMGTEDMRRPRPHVERM